MGRFAKKARESAERVKKNLEDELVGLTPDPVKFEKLFPGLGEQEAVNQLLKKLKRTTKNNLRAQEIQAFGKKWGKSMAKSLEDLVKVATVVLLLIGMAPASASALPAFNPEVPGTAQPAARSKSLTLAVADALRHRRLGTALEFGSDKVESRELFYVPIPRFHARDKPEHTFFEIGIGVEYIGNEQFDFVMPFAFNAGESLRRLFSGSSTKGRVSYPDLSSVFFGPAFSLPLSNEILHLKPFSRFRLILAAKWGGG